jgi:hypothetical protein
MSQSELDERIEQLSPLVAAVCRTLQDEVHKMGFEEGDVAIGELADAAFWLDTDPASGEPSLIGEWRDDKGMKVGGMAFHADGSFFAEHDVVRTHPSKPRFFVEAVTAWGRDDTIKSEPRLLPMVS